MTVLLAVQIAVLFAAGRELARPAGPDAAGKPSRSAPDA